MYRFPTDVKQIRARIRRYERALELELNHEIGRDGYGKRFLLGPLYLLAGDVAGALAHFAWFEEAFPDSCGEPYQYLMWSLALYRGNRRREACIKLYQTMLQNPYLIPHLLGDQPRPLQIWHGTNLAEPEYALDAPTELLALWNAEERAWARQVSEHPVVVCRTKRYVEIHRALLDEPRGRRRNALVNESCELEKSRLDDLA